MYLVLSPSAIQKDLFYINENINNPKIIVNVTIRIAFCLSVKLLPDLPTKKGNAAYQDIIILYPTNHRYKTLNTHNLVTEKKFC